MKQLKNATRTLNVTEDTVELHSFFEISSDMFGYISCDGSCVALNSAWQDTLGFTPPEIQNRQWDLLIHPADRQETLAKIEQVKTGEHESVTFENRFQCQDASYKWLKWHATQPPEADRCYIVGKDITLQKQLEAKLRENETRFQQLAVKHTEESDFLHTLMENTPDHIYFKDTESRFVRINRSLADRFGLKKSSRGGPKNGF